MNSPTITIRVPPEVKAVLDRLPDRSEWLRQAIVEKMMRDLADK